MYNLPNALVEIIYSSAQNTIENSTFSSNDNYSLVGLLQPTVPVLYGFGYRVYYDVTI